MASSPISSYQGRLYFKCFQRSESQFHITLKFQGGIDKSYIMPMNATLWSLRKRISDESGIPFHQIKMKINQTINLSREIEEFNAVE